MAGKWQGLWTFRDRTLEICARNKSGDIKTMVETDAVRIDEVQRGCDS